MRFSLIIYLLLSVMLLACDGRPSGVPSKGKMKRILYDYHKAQAMVGTTDQGEYINSEKLILSVLDKHGIDSEMFDSAMVWYCENPEQLRSIYQDIEKQLKAEDEELQAKVGSSEMTSIYSEGDTTNIWTGASLIVLRPQPLLCLERFTLKADTSYRPSDHFILNADVKFIKEDRSASSTLYMALTLRNKEGKTYSQVLQPRGSSIQRIDISQESEQPITDISGFFYYKSDQSTTKSMCVINGISLIRMHVKEAADSLNVDSLNTDSLNADSLIPEAQRQQDDTPTIPSVQLSDSAPSGSTIQPRKPVDRKNEVKDIKIRRAPDVKPAAPVQRRQSIQQGRQTQPQRQAQPRRPQPGRNSRRQ